jgi:hypothetical protein
MPINQATFLMTNMIPQAPDNNQGPWANMENYLRTLLPANELYIIAGGAGDGGTGSSGRMSTFAGGKIAVPAVTWKVALVIPKASGDDVSRVSAATRTIAVILPNTQGIRNVNWLTYMTTVDEVEALTGYDFYENLPDAVENSVEAGTNGVNPPGVEDNSISLNEDTPQSVTLTAASSDNSSLSYTIVSQPMHGTLSGAAPNLTYTPAPNYNGTDSFTFRASNGTLTSNTAAVLITVNPINDVPNVSNSLSAQSVQYSDPVQTVEIVASDIETSAPSLNATAKFSNDNGATWTPGLPAGLNFAPGSVAGRWTVSGSIAAPSGSYVVQVAVSDAENASTMTSFSIVVDKEKTTTDYTGDFDLMTAGPAINTANVRLAAQLTQDSDGSIGDISKATVKFNIFKFSAATPSFVIENVPVDVDGRATAITTLPADTYSISVEVDAANAYWAAYPINIGLLSVNVPSDEQRSSGGGWVPDATSASGKANLAFSVSASRNGQPKGNVSFSFRESDGFNYLVKGNSWQGRAGICSFPLSRV